MERANESRVTDRGWRGFSTELPVFDKVPWERCFHSQTRDTVLFRYHSTTTTRCVQVGLKKRLLNNPMVRETLIRAWK